MVGTHLNSLLLQSRRRADNRLKLPCTAIIVGDLQTSIFASINLAANTLILKSRVASDKTSVLQQQLRVGATKALAYECLFNRCGTGMRTRPTNLNLRSPSTCLRPNKMQTYRQAWYEKNKDMGSHSSDNSPVRQCDQYADE